MHFTDVKILTRLQAIGEQDGKLIDIGEAVLLLANLDLPENNLAGYLAELDLIASDMSKASRGVNNVPEQIAAPYCAKTRPKKRAAHTANYTCNVHYIHGPEIYVISDRSCPYSG